MHPHILLLNGPAGVGKTTVSKELVALHSGTVCIQGDTLRSFAPLDARNFLNAGSTYRAAATLSAAYLAMGAHRVIFEYVFENAEHVQKFENAVKFVVPVYLITLWAPFEIIQARERIRPDRERLESRVEACYRALEANLDRLGIVIPTANVSPREVAASIQALSCF